MAALSRFTSHGTKTHQVPEVHPVFYETSPNIDECADTEVGGDTAALVDESSVTRMTDVSEERQMGECRSITKLLHYCERKFLKPYSLLLAVIGLRQPCHYALLGERYVCRRICAYLYLASVFLLLLAGYVLQAFSCFRRDRGFDYNFSSNETSQYKLICYGNLGYSYAIPSLMHFVGYTRAFCLFRVSENEQLQNLMERVFLSSATPHYTRYSTERLVKILWLYIGISILWLFLSGLSLITMISTGIVHFGWMELGLSFQILLKAFLVITTLWHDFVQATLITSYCLQGQLLKSHLQFLREKLLQNTLSSSQWMQEIFEFKKLLKYFNYDLGLIICIFTIVNITWAASGTLWLLKLDHIDQETVPIYGISILNICLWTVVGVVPFLQAARLTGECRVMQAAGHDVRRRPFVYSQATDEELNALLLFTSSLKMRAKLFGIPITGKYLYFIMISVTIIILTLGQCHVL